MRASVPLARYTLVNNCSPYDSAGGVLGFLLSLLPMGPLWLSPGLVRVWVWVQGSWSAVLQTGKHVKQYRGVPHHSVQALTLTTFWWQ